MATADAFETAFVKIGADTSALIKGIQDIPEQLASIQGTLDAKLGAIGDALGAKAESAWKRIGTSLTDFGTTWTAAISLPIAGAGLGIAKFGSDFEAAMSRVQVLGEVSAADLKKLTDQAIELGIKTPFSAKAAADAMGEFAAQGFKANEIMSAMPGILGLAASGQVSTGQAAQVTSDILRGFSISAKDAGMVADVLAKAAADSSVGVADLGNAFKYIGPVASAAGLSFHEIAAALEILGNAGIRGEKAGTGLQQMLNDLINPSKQAAATMNELGIKVVDASGKMLPLATIIEQFSLAQKNAKSQTEFLAQATTIWGQRASDVLPLITAGGVELVKQTKALEDSKGAAEKMGNALQNNLKGSLDQFKGSLETLGITLYKSFGPAIKSAVDAATGLVNKAIELAKAFGEMPRWVQTATLAFAGLLAAIGPVTLAVGSFMTTWTKLAPLLSLGATGISTVIAVLPKLVADMGAFIALSREYGVVQALSAAFPGLSAGMTTAATAAKGLTLSMATLGTTVALVAGAVATYKIGEALYNWKTASDGLRDATSLLEKQTKQLEVQAKSLGIAISSKGKTLEQYNLELNKAIRATPDYAEKLKVAGTETVKTATAQDKLVLQMQETIRQLTAGAKPMADHAERLSASEKAAKKYADQIGQATFSTQQFLEKLQLKWGTASLDDVTSKSKELSSSMLSIDQEIAKLKNKFGAELPPAIQASVVHLQMAKNRLTELQNEARDRKDLEQAFQKLNAEIMKTPATVGAIPPIIQALQADLNQKMTNISASFEQAGNSLKTNLSPEPLKNPWSDFGTRVFGNDGVLPNFLKELSRSKGGLDGIIAAAKTLPGALKDAFIGTVAKSAFDELDKRFAGLGTALSGLLKDTGSWGDKFKAVGASLVENLITNGLNKAISKLAEFGAGLPAIGKTLTSVFGGFGGIFGGAASGAGAVAGQVAGGAAQAGSTAASTAGQVAGAAANAGIQGMIGAVTGVISAATGVIQAFQMASMGKDMGRVEENTRGTLHQLRDGIQPQVNEWLPKLEHTKHLIHLEGLRSDFIYAKDYQLSKLEMLTGGNDGLLGRVDRSNEILMGIYEVLDQRIAGASAAVPTNALDTTAMDTGNASLDADMESFGEGRVGVVINQLTIQAQGTNGEELAGEFVDALYNLLPTA